MIRARFILPLSSILFLLPAAVDAQSVLLEWDPVTLDTSDQTEHLRGYDIGYGSSAPGGSFALFFLGLILALRRKH